MSGDFMTQNARPKRALIAYCVLADKLRTPGVGYMQALSPFLAEACRQFDGELFDADKFSVAVADRYGIRIPRLAALGLTEQLAADGILTPITPHSLNTAYRYTTQAVQNLPETNPLTESQIEEILRSFVAHCREDNQLNDKTDSDLHNAFLDRLLHLDSMRLLGKRDASIAIKRTASTLLKQQPQEGIHPDRDERHIDYVASQFLLDLRDNKPSQFERVSDIAFANMAAEAVACFQEPSATTNPLDGLTVYLDSPLLLDMLGVNTEYADYGKELLDLLKANGVTPAVFDHCIAEAESAVHAQLNYLRSGINRTATDWGISTKPDLLATLADKVGDRAESILGIKVHRDPEHELHRKSASAVGDIEHEMNSKMQAWNNEEAKEYDRKSVWAMIALLDNTEPVMKICDSKWILLTRNTPLVAITNKSWHTWLQGATKSSRSKIERVAPIAFSDKQFAGYLWARSGGSCSISKARLLAHCSAAVRPRADVKARAYNLVLELNGKQEAELVGALFEDREGGQALMRATKCDPEDVTRERLPFILEQVKLAAGEYAASKVRDESKQREEEIRVAHAKHIEKLSSEASMKQADLDQQVSLARKELLQKEQNMQGVLAQLKAKDQELLNRTNEETKRIDRILRDGLEAGISTYRFLRWGISIIFGLSLGHISLLSLSNPLAAAILTVIFGTIGFWFVPEMLDRPLHKAAFKQLQSVVRLKDSTIELPSIHPDFRRGSWDI